MQILTLLRSHEAWLAFLEYKQRSGNLMNWELKALSGFIEQRRYLQVARRIESGEGFSHPKKSAISKLYSEKKRIVYTYPPDENTALKFITYHLLRKYDHLFPPNLYSFRPHTGVGNAIRNLSRHRQTGAMYSYKADISNYFNSIPVKCLLPLLEETLHEEPALFHFLASLLEDPYVIDDGKQVREEKGIMAGTPVSTFLANLYLIDLDWAFFREKRLYARYSDDIILFSSGSDELEMDIQRIYRHLESKGLSINPRKESRTAPEEPWVFLGLVYCNGVIDVAPASVDKIKAKMRRKARALKRWADRKDLPGERAAKAFIRVFNRKLFQAESDHDLTWARWYFPLITTADSLHAIDLYAQECIRYLATGKHTKAAYNFRYEQMKELGYICLVNAYYAHKRGEDYNFAVESVD